MLDGLTENLDGVWVIGFNQRTASPLPLAIFGYRLQRCIIFLEEANCRLDGGTN